MKELEDRVEVLILQGCSRNTLIDGIPELCGDAVEELRRLLLFMARNVGVAACLGFAAKIWNKSLVP